MSNGICVYKYENEKRDKDGNLERVERLEIISYEHLDVISSLTISKGREDEW